MSNGTQPASPLSRILAVPKEKKRGGREDQGFRSILKESWMA
jgi:hypothetical protein